MTTTCWVSILSLLYLSDIYYVAVCVSTVFPLHLSGFYSISAVPVGFIQSLYFSVSAAPFLYLSLLNSISSVLGFYSVSIVTVWLLLSLLHLAL